MNHLHYLAALRWGSIALITSAVSLAAWQMYVDETGLPHRYWRRYTGSLERKLRAMFIFIPGQRIAVGQLLVAVVVSAISLLVEIPMWWMLLVVTAVAPAFYIESERRKRVALIEDQLDGFMLALSNALKATPSVGAAFGSLSGVIEDPIRQEVDLAIKEMKVGASLEQALLSMASRVGSRQLDSALSSILIGQKVGGNLPKVLESTAQSLREMKRLEGVIRTKTADGRMQMWVIGAMPIIFLLGLGSMWPGYFDPLTRSFTGYCLIVIISVSWVSALILARKVLAVDL